jgi:hypothetical protein
MKIARHGRRTIVFEGESAFMLQPTVRRTWAPCGQTPILRSCDRHDRITAVSATAASPGRRRLGLVVDLLDRNLAPEDCELLVDRLLWKVSSPITVIMDRLRARKSATKRLLIECSDRLGLEWLQPSSPDLKPTEHVRGHTK